ncbi:hypothetical protein [Cyanobium sp. Morenito 9A2]|nr:hypothetical protein [Cyanobium sp. Morenito 9A2]MCP9848774.1 hypothetical protein [Cyanobium sp. Morenito 9A2]
MVASDAHHLGAGARHPGGRWVMTRPRPGPNPVAFLPAALCPPAEELG